MRSISPSSFIANQNAQLTFNAITTDAGHMIAYFKLNEQGTVVINRERIEGVALGLPPHQQHPAFNVDGDAMAALVRFHGLTQTRMAAGTCDPPRLVR